MRNHEWFDGAPEKLEPGMVISHEDYDGFLLVGHASIFHSSLRVKRWAWVIKPHELEWLEDMAGKHAKGRPDQ